MKFIKGLLKVIASGIVAVAIICGLLCFYDIKVQFTRDYTG